MTISLGLLVVCFVIRMPITIGMTTSSMLYLAVKGIDPSVVVEIFTGKMYNNFILLAVPLFIFAANIVSSDKVTDKIFDFSKVLVDRWKDGLEHVSVAVSLVFSGMTGSAVAGTSKLGIMEIEAMRRERYDGRSNATMTAGPAIMGPIFPPSIPLVIYGVIANASIGNLFLVGVVPGVMLALALCIYVYYIANKRNYPSGRKYARMEFIRMTVNAVPVLLAPIILLMGIYTDIMAATEAGAAAALCALLVSVLMYRSITLSEFIQILKNTVKSAGQIGIMLGAARVFSYMIVVEDLPSLVENPILSFAITKVSLLVFINILLFILGMLLNSAVLQLVLLPVLCSVAQSFGTDVVHFGIVFTLNTMIGLCIPPFGMLLFIVTGTSGERMNTIVKEVTSTVFVVILMLILVTFASDIIMWLPGLFGR